MPDFAMCLRGADTCRSATTCRRSKASGTKPDPLQWYGAFGKGADPIKRCREYMPARSKKGEEAA